MRIALFSDVHANLPALEAFFLHLGSQQVDAVYCLGDLVGYNIWPNEVIHLIRSKGIPTIAGNYDAGIGRASNECGCAYKSAEEKANGNISISLTNEWVRDEERQYLRSLPASLSLNFEMADEKLTMLLVHGSPRKNNEYLFEDRDEKSLLRIIEDANADILCFGHTHKPFHRILNTQVGGNLYYRHAINIGSTGKPKDEDSRGGYVIINIDQHSSCRTRDSIKVEFIRFEYDVEKAAMAIENSALPNAYAESLRTGK